MKVADYLGNPTEATPFETVDIGISKSREGQLMILNVLSNTLYTDKISAVWREYGCNAADANIEAGKADLPIKIVLPSTISPTAVIRDYGYGMTKDQVLNTFCYLGESTKRKSNEVTGMLGIGSKAGFAYGDSFLVVSYTKGTKVVYNCYRDQGVPKLAVMHTEQTDEADGVEIKIPVRREDIATFAERAERVFRYFKVRPDVKGGTINWKRVEPKFKGSCWAFTGAHEGSIAVMGNVGYKIDTYSLGLTEKLKQILEEGVELYFDIGELEITANREGLQYKGKTIPAIETKLKILSSELAATITQSIASAPSFWDAKKAFGAAFERGGSGGYYGSGLSSVISNQVTWNNIPVKTGRFNILNDLAKDGKPDPEITITCYTKANWRRTVRKEQHDYVYADDNDLLVENDLPKKGPSPARARHYFTTHSNIVAIVIMTFQTDKAKARFWKAKHLDGAPVLLLSTFPKPPPIVGATTNTPYNSKYSSKVFVLDEKAVSSVPSWKKEKCSDWWKQDVIKKGDGGVYVTIRQFEILASRGFYASPPRVLNEIKACRAAGLLTTPLYGFKEDRVATLGPKWIKLGDHLKTQIDAVMKWPTAAKDLAEYFKAAKYDGFFNAKHLSTLPIGSLAANLIVQRECALKVKYNKIYAMLYAHQNSYFLKCPILKAVTLDFDKLEKQTKERYPLLDILPRHEVLTSEPKEFKPIAEYINLIEKDFGSRTPTNKKV